MRPLSRGYYLPNPSMDIEVDERWVNIYDLLRTDVLAREKDDKNLQYLLEVLGRVREDIRQNAKPLTAELCESKSQAESEGPLS